MKKEKLKALAEKKKEKIADFISDQEKDKLKFDKLKLKGKIDYANELKWKDKSLNKEIKLREL